MGDLFGDFAAEVGIASASKRFGVGLKAESRLARAGCCGGGCIGCVGCARCVGCAGWSGGGGGGCTEEGIEDGGTAHGVGISVVIKAIKGIEELVGFLGAADLAVAIGIGAAGSLGDIGGDGGVLLQGGEFELFAIERGLEACPCDAHAGCVGRGGGGCGRGRSVEDFIEGGGAAHGCGAAVVVKAIQSAKESICLGRTADLAVAIAIYGADGLFDGCGDGGISFDGIEAKLFVSEVILEGGFGDLIGHRVLILFG